MAITFFALWIVWSLQSNGPGGFVSHIFGYKGNAAGAMKMFLIVIFLAVGLLEVISILFRPVSLSFRLYGNVFAGENILETMSHMGGSNILLRSIFPIPFYFLELIVGLVQALVFTLLTSVFTLLMCKHDEGHEHAHGEAHH
jgi:F-type H+-transporting ATPase subunit a